MAALRRRRSATFACSAAIAGTSQDTTADSSCAAALAPAKGGAGG